MSAKIIGEDIWSYHAHDAVSSTKLDVFHESPLAYFEQFVTKVLVPKSSWEFDFGQAFHARMESEEAFQQHTVQMQFKDWRTDASKAWREEMTKARKLILTADERLAIAKMEFKVRAHPIIAQLLPDTEAEVTWRRSFGKYAVQCRTDRWCGTPREITLPSGETRLIGPYFIDWKTTASITQFRKNWMNFGYGRQSAFYQETLLACGATELVRPTCFWGVVESEPPHDVRLFTLGEKSLPVARGEVITDLRLLRHCYETGNWTHPAEIEELDYPKWAVDQAEDRLLRTKARLELNA